MRGTRLLLLTLLCSLALGPALRADDEPSPRHGLGDWSVGFGAGLPSGLTAKGWLDHDLALDLGVGSLGFGSTEASAGLSYHLWGLFHSDRDDLAYRLPLYLGLGGMVLADQSQPDPGSTLRAGVRATLGISYIFPEPFELFAEASPAVLFTPAKPLIGVLGSVGARYYLFNGGKPNLDRPKPAAKAALAPAEAPISSRPAVDVLDQASPAQEPSPSSSSATSAEPSGTPTAVPMLRRVGGQEEHN
jgi:hypothetical protein